MRIVNVVALLLLSLGSVYAADVSIPRSVKCEFPQVAFADWQKEKPLIETKAQTFAMHFDNIDLERQTVRMIGNAGSDDLAVFFGGGVLHFIEMTPSGNLNLTTLFTSMESKEGFKAVHSRHVNMMGGPLPSQQYGRCRRWD